MFTSHFKFNEYLLCSPVILNLTQLLISCEMGKRRQVPAAFKQEVLQYIEEKQCSVHAAYVYFTKVKKMDYTEGMYYQWHKKRESIMALPKTKKRCTGAGRPPVLEELENVLFDQIVEMRTRKMKVSRSLMRGFAQKLAQEASLSDFKASSTWCTLFMGRFKLSLRRVTNLTTLTDSQLVQRSVDYMMFLQETLKSVSRNRTLLMDETAIYFEDCRTQTIDFEGRRHVIMKSTGFSSMRITACVGVWATGDRAAPLLIHKGKDSGFAICRKTGPILASTQSKAWVNSDLLVKWIDAMFPVVDVRPGKCLVWDSCRAHISNKVKEHCRTRNIKMVVIPGGCTPYLQAGDIGIFRILKDNLSETINAWKVSDAVEYTRAGNPKAPSHQVVEGWFRDAWRAVSPDNIKRSVESAGFHPCPTQWHVAKHDVYGQKFLNAWEAAVGTEVNQEMLEIDTQLDDMTIDDE